MAFLPQRLSGAVAHWFNTSPQSAPTNPQNLDSSGVIINMPIETSQSDLSNRKATVQPSSSEQPETFKTNGPFFRFSKAFLDGFGYTEKPIDKKKSTAPTPKDLAASPNHHVLSTVKELSSACTKTAQADNLTFNPQSRNAVEFLTKFEILMGKRIGPGLAIPFIENAFVKLYFSGETSVPTSAIDLETWKESGLFEIINDLKNENSFFHFNLKVPTLGGVYFSTLRLAAPPTDINIVEKRRENIRRLVDNSELFNTLSSLFKAVEEHEKHVFSFYDKQMQPPGRIDSLSFKPLPLIGSALNTNHHYMSLGAAIGHAQKITTVALGAIGAAVPYLYAANSLNLLPERIENNLDDLSRLSVSSLGNVFTLVGESPILRSAALGLLALTLPSTTRSNWDWLLADMSSVLLLTTKVQNTSLYFKKLKELYNLMSKEENKNIKNNLEHFALLEKCLNSPRLTAFFKALDAYSLSFNSDLVSLLFAGPTLVVAREIVEADVQALIEGAVIAVSEIATLYSRAEMVRNSSDEFPVCIPTVNQNSKEGEGISLKGAWTPYATGGRAPVLNDLELKTNKKGTPSKIFLSGFNKGGKSLILQTLALNAANPEICFAKEAALTPFNLVGACMVKKGNAQESTFSGQAKRINDLIDRASVSNFSLLVFDEPCGGAREDGAKASLTKILRSIPENTLVVCASHTMFEEEEVEELGFSPFKMEVINKERDVKGMVIKADRTFKMIPGIEQDTDAASFF